MIPTKFIAPILSVVLLTACEGGLPGSDKKLNGTLAVDDRFIETSMGWRNQPTADGFIAKWRSKVIDNEVNVCGAVTFPLVGFRRESKQMLQRSYIEVDDKKVMRDLRFFTPVKNKAALATAQATCASTGVAPPQGEYSVRFSWDPWSVRK